MKAKYDLSKKPANFNFVEWLVAATTLGATHVCLCGKPKNKFSPEETKTRIESILVPACVLAGVGVSFEDDGIDICDYHIDSVLDAYRKTGGIKKLRSVLEPEQHKFTVTLRNYGRNTQRDSSESEWRKFADEIGAFVIDDWSKKPIDLLQRMSIYCWAKMNWHVANGPAALCYLSEAPFIVFMKNCDKDYHERHGFPVGSQLPWLNKKQRFIWEANDSYKNLMASIVDG